MITDQPDLLLQYTPQEESEAKRAITEENIEHIDISGLPIEIAVANIDQYENEEYALLRRQGIGASEVSVVVGVNPYKTREELIQDKVRKTLSEEEKAIGEKTAVKKGRDLEPLIISKFQKHFNQKVVKPADMYRFKEYPYLTLNFDGVTLGAEGYIPAEIKVVTSFGERHYNVTKTMYDERNGFKPLPTDISGENASIQNKAAHYGIPPYYYTQLQQQMAALNAPYGYLSVLFDRDWQFYTFLIWRDQTTINAFITEGWKVWQQIEQLKAQQPSLD